MNIKSSVVLLSSLMAFSSLSAFASGGGSYGGGGGFGNRPVQRQVDQTYETGKAIYTGRKRGVPKLSYCVVSDGEKVPVKAKSLKGFKNGSYNELAQNLYDCDKPETPIAAALSRDSFLHVVYYLNKRHRLKLRGS